MEAHFEMKLISGRANIALSKEISDYLKLPLCEIETRQFSDGEVFVTIQENIRGRDVFILQPTCAPVNENLMELAILIDAVRRASAKRITAVMPYYGYARQDRKTGGREPITSKLVANLLTAAGTSRVVSVDLHSGQIQGFFDIPLDHLYALPYICKYLLTKNIPNPVVISPDAGAATLSGRLAKMLQAPFAVMDKRRPMHNVAEIFNIVGDVKDKNAIIIDDMIDTGGTITEAVKTLKKKECRDIYVCATHGVLSGPAIDRIKQAPIKELIVTNSIPIKRADELSNLKVISLAPLLGEAIRRIHENESVSFLIEHPLK